MLNVSPPLIKDKPVVLYGAKLELNGILIKVSTLSRKMPVLSGLVCGRIDCGRIEMGLWPSLIPNGVQLYKTGKQH